jgi:hypothetical protein
MADKRKPKWLRSNSSTGAQTTPLLTGLTGLNGPDQHLAAINITNTFTLGGANQWALEQLSPQLSQQSIVTGTVVLA